MQTLRRPTNRSPLYAGLLSLAALLFLVACGNNSTTTGASAAVSATPTCPPTVRLRSVSGTVQSLGSGTVTVLTAQGQSQQVSYGSTTRFTKQVQEKVSDLKEGDQVTVVVNQNSDNTYSAVSIAEGGTATGFGSGRQGQSFLGTRTVNTACFTRRQGQGNGFGNGSASTQNMRAVRGSITQIAGNQLTVTDSSGSNFVLTLTSSTRVIKTETATAADLKVGIKVLAIGSSGAQGQLAATTVTINPQGQRTRAG
jgi:Cu/Ag efflux protein CusF